jgi:hypothetical protein
MILPLVRERVSVWLLVSGHGARLLKGECGIGSRADVTLMERRR